MDTLAHHHAVSVFKNHDTMAFFGANSWVRKYKDFNPIAGRKHIGSKTWLVWTTDGWHLFQFFMIWCLVFSILTFEIKMDTLEYFVMAAVVYRVVWGMVFEAFYGFILLRKTWGK